MGISALIDSNGKVLKPESVEPTNRANTFVWKINYPSLKSKALPVSEWHQFKAVEGILIASVPIDDRFSLYAKTGDILPLACLFVVILIYFRIRKPV